MRSLDNEETSTTLLNGDIKNRRRRTSHEAFSLVMFAFFVLHLFSALNTFPQNLFRALNTFSRYLFRALNIFCRYLFRALNTFCRYLFRALNTFCCYLFRALNTFLKNSCKWRGEVQDCCEIKATKLIKKDKKFLISHVVGCYFVFLRKIRNR